MDTSPEIEKKMIEIYRKMSIVEKVQRVFELTELSSQFAMANLREKYPAADERELRIRLAARRYDRQLIIDAFGWDPKIHGY